MSIHSEPKCHNDYKQCNLKLSGPDFLKTQVRHCFCEHVDKLLICDSLCFEIKLLINSIMVMLKMKIAKFIVNEFLLGFLILLCFHFNIWIQDSLIVSCYWDISLILSSRVFKHLNQVSRALFIFDSRILSSKTLIQTRFLYFFLRSIQYFLNSLCFRLLIKN